MPKEYLSGNLLVAVPVLQDPNFDHTVTYLCLHNEEGAFGLVINRPLDGMVLGDLLSSLRLSAPEEVKSRSVYYGGPVQPESGFVLHKPIGHWSSTLKVSGEIGVTTSKDILEAIAAGEGPEKFLVMLGYAGWGAGQLEREIVGGAWLVAPADEALLFDLPAEAKWRAAADRLGVDLDLMISPQGEA